MKFYCGIDLSARDCHVCVIDQQLKIVVQQKLRNELSQIIKLLEPYQADLKIVVEEHLQLVLADRWFTGCGFRSGAGPHPRSLPDHGRQSENRSP